MFALLTKICIKPMFENELETFAFGHRFANDCCPGGERKVRPYFYQYSSISLARNTFINYSSKSSISSKEQQYHDDNYRSTQSG